MGSTNASGVAEIACGQARLFGFYSRHDRCQERRRISIYLPFYTRTQVNTSRFEVGGKASNPSGLDAFIYPERDIYRPGEQAHFAVGPAYHRLAVAG